MTFLSDWIVHLLYGVQYNQAGSVLIIHIWTGVFVFLGVASAQWLISENYVYIAFFRNFIGAIGNILLNIILIPKFGIQGAAIATLLAWIISAFLFDLILPKTRKMFILKSKALTLKIFK
jgi:O-antigen/teichoic acid export membrane protein